VTAGDGLPARLRALEGDDVLAMAGVGDDRIAVSGTLHEPDDDQMLRFRFEAPASGLPAFIAAVQRVGAIILTLLLLAAWSSPATAQSAAPAPGADTLGRIVGVVTDIANHPLDGALITVVIGAEKASILTGDNGRFMFTAVPVGTVVLSVRRLGYRFAYTKVDVTPGESVDGSVTMTRTTYTLDTVKVLAHRTTWEKPARLDYTTKYDDFYQRRHTSPTGRFYTHEDIARMVNVSTAADILRRVPFIKVRQNQGNLELRRSGRACPKNMLNVILDGLPLRDDPTGVIAMLNASDVEAVAFDGCQLEIWTR
jgi:hypothetical protein